MRTLQSKLAEYNKAYHKYGGKSMKTILITGGTDGIGKALAKKYLAQNYRVIVVGSSEQKGKDFADEVKNDNLIFKQANLSLVSENERIARYIKEEIQELDGVIFCAANLKPQESLIKTSEGFEFTFALYYLSRYYLSYALKELLEESENPFIVNVAAPGMKGNIYLDDLQMEKNYDGQKAQFHGSRLNDLLGVSFSQNSKKVRYILFNPMAARTNGAKKMASGNLVMKWMMNMYYKFAGKDTDELANMIGQHIEKTPQDEKLHAFLLEKQVDLSMETFDANNARLLAEKTKALLCDVAICF